jgi:hypothetical protein
MLDSGEGRDDGWPVGDETVCAGARKGEEGSDAGGVVGTGRDERVKYTTLAREPPI